MKINKITYGLNFKNAVYNTNIKNMKDSDAESSAVTPKETPAIVKFERNRVEIPQTEEPEKRDFFATLGYTLYKTYAKIADLGKKQNSTEKFSVNA